MYNKIDTDFVTVDLATEKTYYGKEVFKLSFSLTEIWETLAKESVRPISLESYAHAHSG